MKETHDKRKRHRVVDWRKPNILLALEFGITGEAVRQMRLKTNAPAPAFTFARKKCVRECWAIWEKRKVIAGLPPHIAEKHLGFSFTKRLLRFAQKHAGVMHSNGRYPWHRMDWKLPNSDLARIWSLTRSQVHVHRSRTGLRKAQWHPLKTVDKNDPSYRKALAAEKRRAAKV